MMKKRERKKTKGEGQRKQKIETVESISRSRITYLLQNLLTFLLELAVLPSLELAAFSSYTRFTS